MYFQVAKFLGDNLGLNQILGFKGSFSAINYCRTCRADKESCRREHKKIKSQLRTRENYLEDVEKLSNGVKERCIFDFSAPDLLHTMFQGIRIFDIIQIPTLDVMHDLNEGICRLEMFKIIKYCLKNKFFTTLILYLIGV